MTDPNPQNEKQKEERRFSQEQYDMLKRCSDKKDMTEWNEWRQKNIREPLLLNGANFEGVHLQGADLIGAQLEHANFYRSRLEEARLYDANLERAVLVRAHLENAYLERAHLEGAQLMETHLEGIDFRRAHLEGADLSKAYLEGADFFDAHLERADLWKAQLENVNLVGAYLHDAVLTRTNLKGADLTQANLEGTRFGVAIVDGSTSLCPSAVDRKTDFRGVGLNSARIMPATKQLLEYNIRRMNWEEWYKDEDEPIQRSFGIFSIRRIRLITNKFLRWLVRKFWAISDYGISTKGVIKTFFKLALLFAVVYYIWGLIDYHLLGVKDYPGIVSNLFVLEYNQQAVSRWLIPFRAIYFSIVTMTTLGFGDMYANAHSLVRGLFGHVLLALQVILGYVLLGALVTRFAVLFTAGGPAGKFADEKTEG